MSGWGRPGEAGLCRADLHVHSRHSGAGHLRVPRLRSGLPDPESLYRSARRRGMQLFTLTDLDTLDGCLELLEAHPDAKDLFVSVELRAVEPRCRAAVSVFVYDLTEAQYREARSLKGDARDLAAWAREGGLLVSLGSLLGMLDAGAGDTQVRELLRLFDRLEIRNGAEHRAANDLVARLVQEARAGTGFGVTAGSNGHTTDRVGRTCTVARAADRAGFLQALRSHRTWAAGAHGTTWSSFAEVLGTVPLHRAAAPLIGRAMERARSGARARKTTRRLDQADVMKFKEKARSFGASGHRGSPGIDEAG